MPTLEHINFPGLDREDALVVQRELERAESAARLFGTGLCGAEVETGWSLGRSRAILWRRSAADGLSVRIWVDLLAPANQPEAMPNRFADDRPATIYREAFRAGFLHGLGRVLYSPRPDQEPALTHAFGRVYPRRRMSAGLRKRLREDGARRLAAGAFEILEGARTDALLERRYQGAARHLAGRTREAMRVAAEGTVVEALLALLSLAMRGRAEEAENRAVPDVAAAYRKLAPRLRGQPGAGPRGHPPDAYALAEFVVDDLLPLLLDGEHLGESGEEVVAPGIAEERHPVRRPREVGLGGVRAVVSELEPGMGRAVSTVVVSLPHVEGGESLIRIDHARAAALEPDPVVLPVLAAFREDYGPRARQAFAEEAGALRRAFAANYERRERGRYRSGKRVGIPHLRRYLTLDDLRLFQRLEAPDTLSYYVHLLIDVSYSMFEKHNAEKALAVGYAFTELLRSLRVPVDVTLYSSGVTELYDHRTDALEPYFGGAFGYLVSGTLEMEALAFARLKADRVVAERKILVVVTDGTPALNSLPAVGASDLESYFRKTLVPWLGGRGLELLAIGLDCAPNYHPRSVCLTEGWGSVDVLMDLLEEMVREGRRRRDDLWT